MLRYTCHKINVLAVRRRFICLHQLQRSRGICQVRTRSDVLRKMDNNNVFMWPKVVLFGDSLTQFSFSEEGCWGSALADKLQRKCDVVNRGFSGYNARWNKLILPRLLPKEMAKDITVITIFLGANDSCLKDLNPTQHVPLEEYQQSLTDMVDYLQAISVSRDKIILIGPPPCDEPSWAEEMKKKERPMSKSNAETKKYAVACGKVAKDCGVDYVNLYDEMMKFEDWTKFLCDGLHLSKAGCEVLDKCLWPLVEKRTAELPMILPPWDEVNYQQPETSLSADK